MHKIPFNYLPNEFNPRSNIKIFNNWKKLIKSNEFTLGPFLEKFEKKLSKYIGVKYCVATNNGTDALILCLKALNNKHLSCKCSKVSFLQSQGKSAHSRLNRKAK